MPLASGTRIGPYEIVCHLGTGGMGEVYRGRDSKLQRDVAIKVLRPAFAENPDYMARFQREARALASLNHPNIAGIYDLQENAIVMELIEGGHIHGPLPPAEALPIAAQLIDAIEAAHEHHTVHRDLKPANIKITSQGIVKVLDFGLARTLDVPLASDSSDTLTMDGTRAGMVVGTLTYMAPEQARGLSVDRRADIWAFGAVIFEVLSGKAAFTGESASDILAAVLHHEPDWTALPPDTPSDVRRLLKLCLTKDRKSRLQSIGDARIFLNSESAPADEPPRSRKPWRWLGAAGLMLLAVASATLWRTLSKHEPRPFLQLAVDAGQDEVHQPTLSPDGTRVAFVANDRITLRRLDQSAATPIPGTEGGSNPFFSPNGQWIAYNAANKLRKIAIEGGTPVTLCDAFGNGGGSWGSDDTIVFVSGDNSLGRVPAGGGTPQQITSGLGDPAGEIMHRYPQLLPDGKTILFTALNGSGQGSLRVFSPGRPIRAVLDNATRGRYLPGGHLVYHRQGSLFAAPMELSSVTVTGPSLLLVQGVSNSGSGNADFDASASGALVYRGGPTGVRSTVSWIGSDGSVEPLALKPGHYLMPRLSPDGTKLVISVIDEARQKLWIYDLVRDAFRPLTAEQTESELLPTWSPDGDFIAFRSGKNLAWTRADGSSPVERLSGPGRDVGPWSFDPDGKWLTVWPLNPNSDLFIAPVERSGAGMRVGEPRTLLGQAGTKGAPAISPDGRWLAYIASESGRFEVYVAPFDPQGTPTGPRWQVSNSGGSSPTWSRSGSGLFYQGLDRRIYVAPYTASGSTFIPAKPRPWFDKRLAETGLFRVFDVAGDGKRVLGLFAAEDSKSTSLLNLLINLDDELRRRLGR